MRYELEDYMEDKDQIDNLLVRGSPLYQQKMAEIEARWDRQVESDKHRVAQQAQSVLMAVMKFAEDIQPFGSPEFAEVVNRARLGAQRDIDPVVALGEFLAYAESLPMMHDRLKALAMRAAIVLGWKAVEA